MTSIRKAMVGFEGEANIFMIDVIDFEGRPWLVPKWLESLAEGWRMPERIVLLVQFQHQVTIGSEFGDYMLNQPIPRALLHDPSPSQGIAAGTVVLAPDIRLPLQSARQH